jgi:tuberculosinol/isotuberculosinol synthase
MEEALISLQEFLQLPSEEVAKLVQASGPKVVVFPINGTRRWFMLEHASQHFEDPIKAYMDIVGERHIEIYKMFFEHGIGTLIAPMFGSELLSRGDEYVKKIGADGLVRLIEHPDFLHFYNEFDVRVRFYGNYRIALENTPYAYLSDIFAQAFQKTLHNKTFRLFYGIFANDASENIAEFAIEFFKKQGRNPNRREIVEAYYGEHVDPATIFIGFDKFSVFDYPLLGLGEEDLYFMVAPSPYMNKVQLRNILYDHLYVRRVKETDYTEMKNDERQFMRQYYELNREQVFGTGIQHAEVWYPTAQIQLPTHNNTQQR